jgi:hypothetical protein
MKKQVLLLATVIFSILTLNINAQWTGLNPILTNSNVGIEINTSTGNPEGKFHIHQANIPNQFGLPTTYRPHIVLGLACDLSNSPEPFINPLNTNDFSVEPNCYGDLDIFKLESFSNSMNGRGPIVSYTGTKDPIVSFGKGRTLFHGGLFVGGAFSVNPVQNSTTVNTDFVVNGVSTLNNGLYTNLFRSINSNPIEVDADLHFQHNNIILKHGDIIFKNSSNDNELRIYSNGNIRAREIKVDVAVIPDYVFKEGYKLRSLPELEAYIQKYKHLPNIKGENEYNEQEGISIGEMNLKLLEKVEELTLYTIQQQKEIEELKKLVNSFVKK